MKQREIINTAIENFTQLTGWEMRVDLTQNAIETDGNVSLTHPGKKDKINLLVEIRNELRATDTTKLITNIFRSIRPENPSSMD